MSEFREFVTAAGLVHLPFKGCPYTWHNSSEGSRSLWKRLDRILVNEAWLGAWPHSSYLSALPRTSDHSPLVLLGIVGAQEATLFRFDNFLARQASFIQSVASVWRHPIHGTRMYGVVCKLKNLKSVFRSKQKEKGDLASNVLHAKEFLATAQALYENTKRIYLLVLVKCCRMVYCAAVKMENMMLHQRAKLNWLKHGDQSSNTGEGECLILPVTEEEIKEAFFDISEESAPGPDGYTSLFYKAAWPVIGRDVVRP
ncbi:UNVERIFIED_CONTAM: hypothetical protein Sradi_3619100 [Sesamum radiatum]|uniref:Uncharacterized protein n=1 Tax=Sesamum radiatum TaxID=300843 RepID=A0AAW2QHR3_SESRA